MWMVSSLLLLHSLLDGAQATAVEMPPGRYLTKIQVVRNPNYPLDVVDNLEEATMPNVDAWVDKKISAGKNNNCALENAAVRREWSDLTDTQREEYVAAVKCLMKLPPKSDKTRFPGALSRFDDFVAYHMTHAMQLHDNLHLFGAHKYFVWLYEEALRNECGYTGYQPYMNYDRYAQDPVNSPLFSGNASSMGANGASDPTYKGVPQPGRTPNIIKSGGGGGCVTEGPFSDMIVSLGPTSMSTGSKLPKNPRPDGTGSNPRCLRRDVNRNAAMGATADRAFTLIDANKEINAFYNRLLGSPPPKNDPYPWGIHTAGHYVAAVDPGGDPNTSPGDPIFYFHHTSLDRLWWIWQMQDPENRLDAIPYANSSTMMPMKDRRATDPKDTIVDLEWLGPSIKLLETHDQLGGNDGAFCYVYI
ncbi:Di-copper centre-containing protein [Pleurostoma richardsiae]|uniref:Di-copper centre-containing protein n=1 Tax=Pleurostoma richardsiae TaxID=41990 RepID=A0AA38RL25_9PEZI|nr:Di-copper centre-containing protein [Pleurostoma richardsiae]